MFARHHYPKGLFTLLFTLMFFFVGFAFIQSLIVLYCTSTFHLADDAAYSLYAAYGALVFGVPLLGGFIGGNIIGYKSSVQIGLILSAIGLFCLAIPEKLFLYAGLASFVMGTGLTVPNIYCLVGQLYSADDIKRQSGFTLSYMGMNLGGFFAMAASGTIQQQFGYQTDFVIGAVSIIVALVLLSLNHRYIIDNQLTLSQTRLRKTLASLMIVLSIPVWAFLMLSPSICNYLLFAIGVASFAYGCLIAKRENTEARRKLILFLVLLVVCLVFWSLYMLAPTALTLFIDRNVDRHVFSWVVPTSSIMSLNPFFIVTVGMLFNLIYLRNSSRSLPIPAKIACGVVLMGMGYLVLVSGIYFASALGLTALAWIVLSYFLQTSGELFVGPIGFSMVGSLVPARFEGIMMGMWQLCIGVSSTISGYLAKTTSISDKLVSPTQTNPIYAHAFGRFGMIATVIGVSMFLLIIMQRTRANSKKTSRSFISDVSKKS